VATPVANSNNVVLDSDPLVPWYGTVKLEVYNIATPPEENRTTAKGNVHEKFSEVRPAVSELCERTDRQTDRETKTGILITILHIPTGAEVIINAV